MNHIHKYFLLLLLLVLSLNGRGQERVYVRTDCARYAPGDRIWFRCFLFEGADREPSGESLYVYAELADTLGSVLNRVKIIQRDGLFDGYLDIPAETQGGLLLLRAYTRNMIPHPEAVFVKAIPVGRAVFRPDGVSPEDGTEPPRCRVPVSFEKTSLSDRDSIILRFALPDLAEGELLDLSLSVSMDRESPSSITGYFRSLPAVPAWEGDHETTQVISGRVIRTLSGRPVSGARVSLISPQAGILSRRESDADGRFRFEGLDFPEGTQYVLKSTDTGGKDRFGLKIEEAVFPAVSYDPSRLAWMEYSGETVEEWDDSLLAASDHLLESSVVTARQESPYNVFTSNSDFFFGPKQIEEMNVSCLHDLLRRVPGVEVIENQCYIRAQTSILNERQPAAIAIDGLIWEALDLDEIDIWDVERVDVFKTGQTVLWGSAGGNGVISITTKSGKYSGEDAARPAPNLRKVTPLGYQRPAGFKDGAPGNRSILWIPQVRTAEIGFSVPFTSRSVRVVLEGVTSLGRLVHEEWEL